MAMMQRSCACARVLRHSPVFMSHSRMVLSHDPLHTVPRFAFRRRQRTAPACPWSLCVSLLVLRSQSHTQWSLPPVASTMSSIASAWTMPMRCALLGSSTHCFTTGSGDRQLARAARRTARARARDPGAPSRGAPETSRRLASSSASIPPKCGAQRSREVRIFRRHAEHTAAQRRRSPGGRWARSSPRASASRRASSIAADVGGTSPPVQVP
mmetsp:Transcript_21246/g.54755  ORF Transcript_21246/g.54755 Transcript_21246/m.54755 type:complete len:212 (+) Transcript_21246:4669-5304(+)